MFPSKLLNRLTERRANNSLRWLVEVNSLTDFSSNDYLGFSNSDTILSNANKLVVKYQGPNNGSTGSRLLTGNHELYAITESKLAQIHRTEEALIFNSGYDANVGVLSSIPQKNDLIIFDELCHASIRDGIRMSLAKSIKFKHNDLESLSVILERQSSSVDTIYIVTESVFSMDGDVCPLKKLIAISKDFQAHLIIDEAHALGVIGNDGLGLVQELGLETEVFARIMTFGKGLGCHGAAVVGSRNLKEYLVNFARSLIYTTALPPHSLATIYAAFDELLASKRDMEGSAQFNLQENLKYFRSVVEIAGLTDYFIHSESAIFSAIISGNDRVKEISVKIREKGFNVLPILSPTVAQGKERIRICVHSYNTREEIKELITTLATLLK